MAECANFPGDCPDNRCHWTCRDNVVDDHRELLENGGVYVNDAEEDEGDQNYVDDSPEIVNSIILARIYDVLLLILANINEEAAGKIAEKHAEGEFAGPAPALRFTSDE